MLPRWLCIFSTETDHVFITCHLSPNRNTDIFSQWIRSKRPLWQKSVAINTIYWLRFVSLNSELRITGAHPSKKYISAYCITDPFCSCIQSGRELSTWTFAWVVVPVWNPTDLAMPCARRSFGLTSSVYVTLLERFPRCHCAAQKCSIYGCPPYWWERIGHRNGTYA